MDAVAVYLWGRRVGALSWDAGRRVAQFQYDPEFIQAGLEISPLMMPLSQRVYQFNDLADTKTFIGLPGVIADSLPEKFGNRILDVYLANYGRNLEDLNPLERLSYVGSRGMGALEYEPDFDTRNLKEPIPVEVSDLVDVAQAVLADRKAADANMKIDGIETLVSVGTSAGGAKAKAVIAVNDQTQHVLSGQTDVPTGYEHWLLKFDEIDNDEHATSHQIGRIEYAYNEMAAEAGINTMDCRLLKDGDRAHFMSKRFDRVDGNARVHVCTFAGMMHADRDPPGNVGYERLFQVIRDLGLGQDSLNEMYRRMVFNICSRNQDDHTKNHAFLMFADGVWQLAPAYDLCFSYKPGNRFIEQHQMACNSKRDQFIMDDLKQAAIVADVKRPERIIDQVQQAVGQWRVIAGDSGIDDKTTTTIGKLHRKFSN